MSAVKITIRSTMGKEQKYEVIATGDMKKVQDTYYVRYREPVDAGMDGTITTLKWQADSLTILRHGTYEHRQEHRTGFLYSCTYKTPYFSLPLKVLTHRLKVKQVAKKWQLDVTYALTLGDTPQGDVALKIRIEEDEVSGH